VVPTGSESFVLHTYLERVILLDLTAVPLRQNVFLRLDLRFPSGVEGRRRRANIVGTKGCVQ